MGKLHGWEPVPVFAERPHGFPDVSDIGVIVSPVGGLGADPFEYRHDDRLVTLVVDTNIEIFGFGGDEFESPQCRPVPCEEVFESVQRVGFDSEGADDGFRIAHFPIISLCAKYVQDHSTEGDLDMGITGVHTLLYSSEAEAVRTLLDSVLGLGHVDDGQDEGWLIFQLPPAEMGVHPGDTPSHEISFMCDDLDATIAELRGKGVDFRGEPVDEGWGIAIPMLLPGGIEMLLYQPRHNTAI